MSINLHIQSNESSNTTLNNDTALNNDNVLNNDTALNILPIDNPLKKKTY